MKPNAINYLSLARKAGRIEVGEEPVGACARAGHARLVMVAGDAPDNTVRRARNFVAGTEQQMVVLPFTEDEMGAALGRSSVALAAMTDPSMALAFLKALEDPTRYGKAIEDLSDRDRRAKQHRQEEKAHERNLRTGKKRADPKPAEAAPKKEEPKTSHTGERAHRSWDRKPAGRPARPYGKGAEGEGRKPGYASERRREDSRPAKAGRPGKAEGDRKPGFAPRSGAFRKGFGKPGFKAAGAHKFGRKTHGGAE